MNILPKFRLNQSGSLIIIVFIIFALLLAALGAGGYFYANSQKKELKVLSQKQSKSLSDLSGKYSDIVDVYRNAREEKNTKTSVLGVKKTAGKKEVLGLEDSPAIISSRQLIELYRDGKNLTRDISETNTAVRAKTGNPLLKVIIKKEAPTKKTDEFVYKTNKMLKFLEQSTDYSIKGTVLGFDLGVAMQGAISNEAQESDIARYEDRITELKLLAKKEAEIDTSDIPKELREDFEKGVKNSQKIVNQFDNIAKAVRNEDVDMLTSALKEIILESVVSAQTGEVEMMNFWQSNPTIRSVDDVKRDWDLFTAAL